MNDDSIVGSTLSQLGGVVKATAKQVAKIPGEMVEDTEKQITAQAEPDQNQKPQEQQKSGFATDEERKDFLKGLYGESNPAGLTPLAGQVDEEFEKQIADKSPEEQKKLRDLRRQLHNQYYQQLVNPPKKQEERPAEKVENEKKQEVQELEQKEAKKPPPLVQRARERVEKFPGTSG